MADVFQRRSGRGWRLRQQSLELFKKWSAELQAEGFAQASLNPGLLLLAATEEEQQRLQWLSQLRQAPGAKLNLLSQSQLEHQVVQGLLPPLPANQAGGLWSRRDGQLDPLAWMQALQRSGERLGLERLPQQVFQATASSHGWSLELGNGEACHCDWLVICAGMGSQALLANLGLDLALEPVSGQALELQLPTHQQPWTGSLVWRGMNLVPRPQGRLWLGATLEPGASGEASALDNLRQLQGDASEWLRQAEVLGQWQGQRARPVEQPAPVLQQPLPQLLVLSGHYRNGILLGPASAAWAADQINAATPAKTKTP